MKTMKKSVLYGAALLLLGAAACQKENVSANLSTPLSAPRATGFVQYVIPKGEHYSLGNVFQPIDGAVLAFTVRFDSSCIYRTLLPENQWDINKLYGFSDNGGLHHQFSARIGWRWSNNALRLFAYTYNNALRQAKELAVVPIGKEIRCAIEVSKSSYLFRVDNKQDTMPRLSTTSMAQGYKLYPYFGGDEAAPHDVRIWIREEK